MHLCICRLHTSLDTEHVSEGILVAVLHLELTPSSPILRLPPGIAELRAVRVSPPCTVDLPEHGLHLRIASACVLDAVLRQHLDCLLIDLTRPSLTEELCSLSKE